MPFEDSKKWLTARPPTLPGFQMVRVMPMNESIRPTVTMSCTTSAALRNRRMSKRSSPIPISGATTNTTANMASGAGQCRFTRSSQ